MTQKKNYSATKEIIFPTPLGFLIEELEKDPGLINKLCERWHRYFLEGAKGFDMGEPPFLNNHEDFFKDTQAISIWARHCEDSNTANLLVELNRQILLFNGLDEKENTLAPLAPRPSEYELEDICSKAREAVSSLQTAKHFFPSTAKEQTQPEEHASPAPDVKGAERWTVMPEKKLQGSIDNVISIEDKSRKSLIKTFIYILGALSAVAGVFSWYFGIKSFLDLGRTIMKIGVGLLH